MRYRGEGLRFIALQREGLWFNEVQREGLRFSEGQRGGTQVSSELLSKLEWKSSLDVVGYVSFFRREYVYTVVLRSPSTTFMAVLT